MKTFILVLSLWNDSGLVSVDVIDWNLTGEDCIAELLILDQLVHNSGGIASCEVDHAES